VQNQLDRIKNEFEREIFLAVYRSREQRLRRARAFGLLFARHFLRGALIGLPIYLLTVALVLTGDGYRWLLLMLLPGVVGWIAVLIRGALHDYRQQVRHRLMQPGFGHTLWSAQEQD
jgi:hypothetical protein